MDMIVSASEQRVRSELRANFLYALCELNGELCNITTFEQTTLNGTFKGWKTDGAEILVRGLQTPTGESMNTALMRTMDIISVEFNDNIVLPTRCKVNTEESNEDLQDEDLQDEDLQDT